MHTHNVISHRSLDQLETDLVSRAARMNAEEYAFLCDVREFDIRQGWKAYNFNNCAEWLNWKCQIVPGTAREKVRVAHCLFGLPRISKAFAEGRISYSMARPMTRIADADNEQELLDYALHRTAFQVENYCRNLRNAQRDLSTDDANKIYRARYLSRSIHHDGSMIINAELPREMGELVMKAIEIAAADVNRSDNDPDAEEASIFTAQADALVAIAKDYLASAKRRSACGETERAVSENAEIGSQCETARATSRDTDDADKVARSSDSTYGRPDNYLVMVHVDESALAGRGGESDLPIETVRRITCDSSLVTIVKDKDGNPLNAGRKRRIVPPHIRRALLARDKTCRFPGCTHTRHLEPHHIIHWADGGETNVDDMVMLCSRHHRLHHEGGYTIHKYAANDDAARDRDGKTRRTSGFVFRNADGRVIPQAPVYRAADADASRDALAARDTLAALVSLPDQENTSRDAPRSGERTAINDSVEEPAAVYGT